MPASPAIGGKTIPISANSTRSTLREAVDVERTAEPEQGDRLDRGWRLLDVHAVAAIVPRRLDAPLVGREWELAQLRHAFERAAQGHTSYLITVLGPAGIGKSRLAHEFATAIADQATGVHSDHATSSPARSRESTSFPSMKSIASTVSPTATFQ